MNVFKALNNLLPANITAQSPLSQTQVLPMGQGLSIYPYGKDSTFIKQGYNKNWAVYAIVSKCAKKFSQVPWYHYKIKRTERKTWNEYLILTKEHLQDPKARIEAKKMRVKSVDHVVIDDDLSKLINRPNRNQSGAMLREQLYGYKLLTGEGNLWLSRPAGKDGKPDMKQPPNEMFIIPRANLAIVKGDSPWSIDAYKLLFAGQEFINPKENILSWKFPNYEFDPVTLTHLRGQSPLDAGLLLMQGSNEGQERIAAMNKNQGVAGLAFNKEDKRQWTVEQAQFNRKQFNSIINDKDLAGSIAYMNGDWGWLQFGLSAEQLQLLEQAEVTVDALCAIFDVPPGILSKDQTYDNRKEQKREFIYDNIAVAAYGLRDDLNARLITEFQLDRERDVIDVDIISLPELAEDLKTQAETLTKLWQLTPNQVLEYIGYDKSGDPNMDKNYIPNNLVPLDQANADMGTNLDNQLNLLNDNQAA